MPAIVASNQPKFAPSVTISAASNFNQSLATLNATVSANRYSTTVKFQYSTSSNFSSYTEVNAATTPITGQAVSSYANITGLSVGTTYYFRCVATNTIGTTTSSSLSFTTWSLKTYANGTAGTHYLSIPTVTPTGGTAAIPSIYNVFILGAGGGAGYWGGGAGGGYRLVSSRAFSSIANTQLTLVVGGGGGYSSGGTGGTGGYTQITASNFSSIDAGGGTGGLSTGGLNGGNVGYGDNPGYGGGAGASFTDTGGKVAFTYTAGGGGAGIGGAGGNATANGTVGSIGGNGGTGGSAYGYNGGAGGGGFSDWLSQHGSAGAYYGWGSGGNVQGNGTNGIIFFQYYGA